MMKYLLPLPLLLTLCACDAPIDPCEGSRISVTLMVLDQDGEGVDEADVLYSVDSGQAQPCEQFGVVAGEYVCGNDQSGRIEITVEAQGFEPAELTVTVTEDDCSIDSEFAELVLESLQE